MTQITNKLLKEAIADAEAVRETAIANAKLVLEESMGPQIKEMIRRRITAEAMSADEDSMEEATETPHEDGEAEGSSEFPADSSDIGGKENAEPSDDSFDTSDIGDTADAPADSDDDWYNDWDENDLAEIIKELENDIAAMKGGDDEGDEEDSEEEDEEGMEDSEEEESEDDEEKLTEAMHGDEEDEEEKTEDDEDEEIDLEEILRELDMEMGDEDEEDEDEEDMEGDEEELDEETYDWELKRLGGSKSPYKMSNQSSAKLQARANQRQKDAYDAEQAGYGTRGAGRGERTGPAGDLSARSAKLAQQATIARKREDREKFGKKLTDPRMAKRIGLTTEITRLRNELAQYQEALQVVRGRLLEVNLLNAKLLFTNKLFRKEGLNNDQKVRIVESFDRATTVREVKLVYTALMENISTAGKTSNGSRRKVVAEGLASKATRSTAPRSKDVIVENAVAKRLQELAGII
jgi:hypothetical protein